MKNTKGIDMRAEVFVEGKEKEKRLLYQMAQTPDGVEVCLVNKHGETIACVATFTNDGMLRLHYLIPGDAGIRVDGTGTILIEG